MIYTNFPRGSQWRRWDLQAGTKYYNRYSGPTLTVTELERLSSLTFIDKNLVNSKHLEISDEDYAKLFVEYFVHFNVVDAVAITNHNTGKGINEILSYLKSKQRDSEISNPYNGKVIFPGVEIGAADRCHILIIFNPDTECDNVYNFDNSGRKLNKKKWDYYIEEFLSAADIPSQRFQGSGPANSSTKSLINILEMAEEWDFICVLPHIFNSAGWWGELQESNRKETFGHKNFGIVDIGANQSNTHALSILNGKQGDWGLKKVAKINTSDANSLTKIGSRFTWIKADLTFSGLKQIIFEPDLRTSIQSNRPNEKVGYHVIERIEIEYQDIYNNKIEINESLNCLIGGRSTGKSLLLAAIAKKLKAFPKIDFENKKYEEYVDEISKSIRVFWKDGEERYDREVEFFKQGYMYELARDSNMLNNLIHGIIKSKGKEGLLLEYEKFVLDNREVLKTTIGTLFKVKNDLQELGYKIVEKGDKEGIEIEIKRLGDEIIGIPGLDIAEEEKTHYEDIKSQIEVADSYLTIAEKDKLKVGSLKGISLVKESITYELTNISDQVKTIVENSFSELKEQFTAKWVTELDNVVTELDDQMMVQNKRLGQLRTDSIFNRITSVMGASQQLNELEEKVRIQKDLLTELMELIRQRESLEKLEVETINKIKNNHKRYYEEIVKLESALILETEGLKISSKHFINQERFKEIISGCIDLRVSGSEDYKNCNFNNNHGFYEAILNALIEDLVNQRLTLKGGHTNETLCNHIFSENFFGINYDLFYENDDFLRMSDGKKAFVVLKLLLEFSDKKCPILIDQPEDSLDNRAIFNELVQYLRDKKQERQIILVTHNANIVVGSDCDLVIISNQHGINSPNRDSKKFQYVQGSLEHTRKKDHTIESLLESQGIREHACEILEGGNIAFKKREEQYGL